MRHLFVIPLLAAAPLFVSGQTPAQRISAAVLESKFKQLDLNGDGRLSAEEAKSVFVFVDGADENKDGFFTLDELRAHFAKRGGLVAPGVEEAFAKLDRNRDGKLTADELAQFPKLKRLDQNSDGVVTLDEARSGLARLATGGIPPASATEEPVVEDASLKEQPQQIKASEHGVGHRVADLALKDAQGREVKLSSLTDRKAVVLAVFRADCPISAKLRPEIARIEQDYAAKGVSVFSVNAADTVASALGATTTTEVFVLDAARTLVYRGAINDQYGLGYAKEHATKTYLRDALDSTLRGEPPTIAATTAPGCALDLPKPAAALAQTDLTYHHQVSRILQSNCIECHRKDGIGPFSLETYEDVVEHAGMIKKQLKRGAMPPWFAGREAGQHESPWSNDRALPEQDKAALLAWLDAGRPQGNPADAPIARVFPAAWSIGTPDVVLQLPKPVQVQAEGFMPYQVQVVETSFPEDRWVQAYEVAPTVRAVVHHVIVKVHDKDAKIHDRGDEGGEGFWAAYVPGNAYRIYPEGFAKKLPAGAKISFQIHYTPNGKAVGEQLRMGLVFAKQAPLHELHVIPIAQHRLNILPGAANHVETTQSPVPRDLIVTAFMAHMHVRGKAFKYELLQADGTAETLLDIPRYDFNWQLQYNYAQPRLIPRGTTMRVTAVFDNSAGNPANPDPTKTVHWGPQTYDEMMIGYVEYYLPGAMAKVALK